MFVHSALHIRMIWQNDSYISVYFLMTQYIVHSASQKESKAPKKNFTNVNKTLCSLQVSTVMVAISTGGGVNVDAIKLKKR